MREKRTLTGTSDGEHDLGRMPCTDTSNLSETLVSLPGKLLGTPTVCDTLESVTLGNSNDIDVLILLKHRANLHRLLEQILSELDLVSDGTTVELDLHKVSFLLGEASFVELGVCEDTDDSAVFADTLNLSADGLSAILGVLLGVTGERLFL
jgi:hypothetical protein